jgi:hypothetical protein
VKEVNIVVEVIKVVEVVHAESKSVSVIRKEYQRRKRWQGVDPTFKNACLPWGGDIGSKTTFVRQY